MESPGSVKAVEHVNFAPTYSGGDFLPPADNTYNLGSAANSWKDLHVQSVIYSTSLVGDWSPATDDTYDLGTSALRWQDAYLSGALYLSGVGVSQQFPTVTANNQSVNATPSALTLTGANAKSYTHIGYNMVLPAIVPVANGSGIILSGLVFSQGAISNVADSEAITVKMITITGAAGVALETGVYTWTGADITMPAQAANAAINLAKGIKITGGATAGAATATQIGIDITMAAATDDAIKVTTGNISIGANKITTTSLYFVEDDVNSFGIRYTVGGLCGLHCGSIDFGGRLYSTIDGQSMTALDTDGGTLYFQARDSGVGEVAIAGLKGAADPYFQVGRDDTGVALNAVTDMLVLQAGGGTGNEAASFGLGTSWKIGNAASEVEERGSIDLVLTTATNASEAAKFNFSVMNAGAMVASIVSITGTSLNIGVAGTTQGLLNIAGVTSGVVGLAVAAEAGTWAMTLPAGANTNAGYQLTCAGADSITSWAAAASLRRYKTHIVEITNPQDGLDLILGTRIYDYNYREGMGTQDSLTRYRGAMADENPWIAHYNGGVFNPINAFANLALSVQALHAKIAELEKELAELKGRVR